MPIQLDSTIYSSGFGSEDASWLAARDLSGEKRQWWAIQADCVRLGKWAGVIGMTPIYLVSILAIVFDGDPTLAGVLFCYAAGALVTGWFAGWIVGGLTSRVWMTAMPEASIKPQVAVIAGVLACDVSIMLWCLLAFAGMFKGQMPSAHGC